MDNSAGVAEGSSGLTLFARIEDDEEVESSTATSYIGGLLGRWFRPPESTTSHVPTRPREEGSQPAENAESPRDNAETQRVNAPPSTHWSGTNGHVTAEEGDDNNRKNSASRSISAFAGGRQAEGLINYNRSDHRQYWMPDSTGRACYQCEGKFTTVRRRHHCRLCGRIFCSKCCNHRVSGAQFGYTGELRLCGYCIKTISDHSRDGGDGPSILPYTTPVTHQAPSGSSSSTPTTPLSNHSVSKKFSTAQSSKPISTVSAGSLQWSESGAFDSISSSAKGTPEQNSTVRPPPALLSVSELYSRHKVDRRRSSNDGGDHSTGEEEESGPEWLRKIDMTKEPSDSWRPSSSPSESASTSDVARNGEVIVDTSSIQEASPLSESFTANGTPSPTKSQRAVVGKKAETGKGVVNEDDVEGAFRRKRDRLLDSLLSREKVKPERWRDTILHVSSKLATTIEVDVSTRKDCMNILQYVHIKKICTEEDVTHAELVEGVVCTQTVTHTSLTTEARNASVMLVAGQECFEVERILSRRPTLLMVEKGATRTVTELLRQSGVRCVLNVRQEVLERVSRSTGADILPATHPQLLQQSIGFCPVFSQRTLSLKGGHEKRLVVLDECPPEKGMSVLIYSRSLRELKAVKRILLQITLLMYSMDLEKAFVNQFGVRLEYRLSACDVCEARRQMIDHEREKSELENALDNSILNMSPFIDVEPPFLETPRGRQCSLLQYFKQPLYGFGREEDFEKRKEKENAEDEKILPKRELSSEPKDVFGKATKPQGEDDLALFRARGGLLFRKRVKEGRKQVQKPCAHSPGDFSPKNGTRRGVSDVLDPLLHQRVAVLFGSFSNKSPNAPFFCVRPWVVSMQFYGANDMTMGEFLTKYCFNKDYACPSSGCDVPMLDHSRKMVLGRVCVEVTTQQVSHPAPPLEDGSSPFGGSQILCWHYCPNCKVRPFDVLFSPLACRIEPSSVAVQFLVDGVKRMAALATEMTTNAEEQLKEKRDKLCVASPGVLANLEPLYRHASKVIAEELVVAEELKEQPEFILSNSPLAIKARHSTIVLRDAAYRLLTEWNAECVSLAAAMKSMRKTADDNGMPPPIHETSLDRLEDPFPSHLHLSLPLAKRVDVVVRDVQDSRGLRPDIGSIVAYALATIDYEEGRRKTREAGGGEDFPLNLSAASVGDEAAMLAEHLESEFADGAASYYVKSYFAERFRLLRRLLLTEGEDAFIRSLSESTSWMPQGGKSGAHFYRSCDGRFVLKQMSRFEVQSFSKFAPSYFDYIKTAVTEKKLTMLCKVYGVFRVGYKSKSGQHVKMDILVMEHLFYKHEVAQIYDLKGSLRNRMAETGMATKKNSEVVLLDENLMKDLWNKQLYVLPHAKAALNQAISNDSHFLSSHNVMDYSLLAGVDSNSGQLILGIVDYMRTYTLDKKLESWVKIALPSSQLPTVVSPQLYCTRFSEALDLYFPVVPDQWTGLGSVVSY